MKKMLSRLCHGASICTTIRFLRVCRFMFLEKTVGVWGCVRSHLTKGKEPDVPMATLEIATACRVQTDVVGEKKGGVALPFF